jgi:hypothetical protein
LPNMGVICSYLHFELCPGHNSDTITDAT